MNILRRPWVRLALGVVILALGYWTLRPAPKTDSGGRIAVVVPQLSETAQAGKIAFDANCGRCHGRNATGTDRGPPLVHDIYNPGHHADIAFFMAARRGVRAHHWAFGNMPPQPQVSDKQLMAIVRYIRELQEANGIFFKPHVM